MIKSAAPLLLCLGLFGCATDGTNNRQSLKETKATATDLSYMGKSQVFPAALNGAPAFHSLANARGQSEQSKSMRYFLNADNNVTNASVTLYLLSTVGNGNTVAAQTEQEIAHWAKMVSAEKKTFRVKTPDDLYNSELGGVDFYFGELVQNHVTAYDLYMAEVNNRLVQIRLVGPATRADRIARRDVVSQIAKHLANI